MTENETFRRCAALLSNVRFSEPLTEGEDKAARLILSLERGVRVYKLKGLRWAVNYYKGGEARTWARPTDCRIACRLADMLTLRNAPTRVRLAHVLTPEDFNISEQRAKRDLENEGPIISLIIQMETVLPESPKKAGRPPGKTNRTLRDEVLHIFDTIMFRLNDVLAAQSTADKKLNELRHILHLVQTRSGMLPAPTEIILPYAPPVQHGWPLPPGPTCTEVPETLVPGSPTLAPTIFCAGNIPDGAIAKFPVADGPGVV